MENGKPATDKKTSKKEVHFDDKNEIVTQNVRIDEVQTKVSKSHNTDVAKDKGTLEQKYANGLEAIYNEKNAAMEKQFDEKNEISLKNVYVDQKPAKVNKPQNTDVAKDKGTKEQKTANELKAVSNGENTSNEKHFGDKNESAVKSVNFNETTAKVTKQDNLDFSKAMDTKEQKSVNGLNTSSHDPNESTEKNTATAIANIPDPGRTHASGNVIINEGSKHVGEKSNMRDELIKKIMELENQKKALEHQRLIKEIQALQTEVQTDLQGETKNHEVSLEGTNTYVIPNNVAPRATEISAQSGIDEQIKELNEKIEKTSKYVNERKKYEDLSSLSNEDLQKRVEELKMRKDYLTKHRQKSQVINMIQDLHKQVSAMKQNVKSKDDRVIPSDRLKVYPLSPSEVDVYWSPSDFADVKNYTLFYREKLYSDTVFSTIRPEVTQTSHVIENLKRGTMYEIKFEALTQEGYRITTEITTISTYKSVSGFALILANHTGFHLPHLKDLPSIPADAYQCRNQLESFGFEVAMEENLTGSEMIESVEKHSLNLEHQNINTFICIVTGYMYSGYVYGIDGVPVLLQRLFEPLRVADKKDHGQPPIGEGKVKMIFIDAFKVKEIVVEELDDSFQPREVQFRSSSNKTIETSWKRPKLSKKKLKKFKLLLKNTSTSQTKYVPFTKENDSYFHKFSNLIPNTEYNIEISAEYEDKSGKAVRATLTTFEPQFMQPRKLSVEAVSSSQVYVYWIPPLPTPRIILGYKVAIRDQTREEYHEQVTTYTCLIFSDLVEDTEYNISVTTLVKGLVVDYETEVKDEESMPVYIDITTLTDRTPTILAGPTVNYEIEEPDFYIASATASTISDSPNSFLNTIMRHLTSKYAKNDVQSILEDVKKELMCSTNNYEIPQSLTTLRHPIFFGK